MKPRNKNKYIIFLLIGILCLMGAGFAGFSQRLSVNESATNTNSWNISITNVKIKGGTATNNSNPTFTDLTATFDATFDTHGEYIEYEVEVTNKGNVNASLNQITLSGVNNVVTMSYSGISEGETLAAGAKKTFTVKLLYNSGIASGNLYLTLDYVQGDGSSSSRSVYRWNSYTANIGDSIDGLGTTTDPSTLGRISYLKHDVDSNNKITASYSCFVTDKEYCLKGGDSSAYASNKAIMQANEAWFENDYGYCAFDETTSVCRNSDSFSRWSINNSGFVYVMDGNAEACHVYENGSSNCGG